MTLTLRPTTYREACLFVDNYHRHHRKPQGCRFCLAAWDNDVLVGVIIAGRPVSRMLDDGLTLEITRCCTDGTRNACSFLYAAVVKVARTMGYRRIITYILDTEPGSSLKALSWKYIGPAGGGDWSRSNRPRTSDHPQQPKQLWEAA